MKGAGTVCTTGVQCTITCLWSVLWERGDGDLVVEWNVCLTAHDCSVLLRGRPVRCQR